MRCDVTRSADVQASLERIRKELAQIDILVNNAGMALAGNIDGREPGDHECHVWAPLPRGKNRFQGRVHMRPTSAIPHAGTSAAPPRSQYVTDR